MRSLFLHAPLAYAPLAAAFTLFALTGCGGGGGSNGPRLPTTPTATPRPTLVPGQTPVPTATPISGGAGGGLLFSDDFSGSFNTAKWGHYTNPQELQRTRFGGVPTNRTENGTTFAHIAIDSYNPNAPGDKFLGTEIRTYQSFAVGDGLEIEARLRAPGLPAGLIAAFFLISDRYTGTPPTENNYSKTEIDYEILTAQTEQFAGNTRNRLYTNIWDDWNFPRDGFDLNDAPAGPERIHDDKVYAPSVDASYDYANWNVYKIRWFLDHTEYYVNGRLERIERDVKPNEAMELHFNIWTPTPDFNQAFSGSLPGPVGSASSPDRRNYGFDVDYVKVTALTTGANSARIAAGAEAAKPVPANLKSYRSR